MKSKLIARLGPLLNLPEKHVLLPALKLNVLLPPLVKPVPFIRDLSNCQFLGSKRSELRKLN